MIGRGESQYSYEENTIVIHALDAIRAINEARQNAVVVSTMTPNRYWQAVTTNNDLDLPIFGAMGKASSVALGLALARPDKKILVLDGDGGLLMNLGSLVTISEKEPGNLVHFVFEDGVYFTTGGQPTPGAGKINLAGMAKDAGFRESYDIDNLEDLVNELPNIMNEEGPIFVCLKIIQGQEIPEVYIGDTGEAMKRIAAKLREE